MSNVTVFGTANLPSVQSLAESLRNVSSDVAGNGTVILKMDKTGHWVYGSDLTEVEDDATWAINPFSFTHGYIAWGEGVVLGEKVVPVSQPLPEVDAPPAGASLGWQIQLGMSLKCVSGEDKGMEARCSFTSTGGKKAMQKLALAIAAQVDKDQTKPVPVVKLRKEHYMHKSYGRVYVPVFDVVDWSSMNGPEETASSSPPSDDVDAPAEGRRRRRGA